MKNSFYKILTFVLLIAIIAAVSFFFPKEENGMNDELGKINEVSTKGAEEVKAKSVFTPVDDTFGYSLKEYKNPRAKMSFSLPDTWDVTWENDRMINIQTPENDKHFKSTSFILRYDYGLNEAQTANDMIDLFKNELYKTPYYVNGEEYKVLSYIEPNVNTDTKYTNGHDSLVACAETKNVRIRKSSLSSSKSHYTKLDYYINWENTPCVLSCIVKNKEAKNAKEFLKLFASNIKSCKQDITITGKTASFNNEFKNLQFKLPHQFKPAALEDNYFLYTCPPDDRSVFSGMSVLMIDYDDEILIDEENINTKLGAEWFDICFDYPAGMFPTFYCNEEDPVRDGENYIGEYKADYTLMTQDKGYPKYFIIGETWKMNIYVFYGKERTEVILVNYQDSQEELAEKIKELNF